MDKKKIIGTVCDILAQYAPSGTQPIARNACRTVTGTNGRIIHDDANVRCTETTGVFGERKIDCRTKGRDSNG